MSEPLNIVVSHTLWSCTCQGGGMCLHRIEAKETLETHQVLYMKIECLNCEKETHLEFHNEKI